MLCPLHKKKARAREGEKNVPGERQRMQCGRGNSFTFLDKQEVCLNHKSAVLKGTLLAGPQEATAAYGKTASRVNS